MRVFRLGFVFMVLVGVIACNSEKKIDQTEIKPSEKVGVAMAPTAVTSLTAHNFSDDSTWKNGVNILEENQFFMSIKTGVPTPVKIGDRLKFTKSGMMSVLGVYRMESEGYSSIFVTVDGKLDPVGDGYPQVIELAAEE